MCRQVLVAPHVQDYAINLVMATQPGAAEAHELANKYIRYGSSPRGAQALVECGRVLALMNGRLHLSIEDIETIAPAVLRHRIILNFDAHADGQTPETILSKIIPSVAAAASLNVPAPLLDRHVSRKAGTADHPLAEVAPRAGRRAQHLALRRMPARSFSIIATSTTATICARSTGAPTCAWKSCFSRCSRWSRAFRCAC